MTFLYLNFVKVDVCCKEDLELLILELFPFAGFSTHVDLTGRNHH
jgi:hypothetical protein